MDEPHAVYGIWQELLPGSAQLEILRAAGMPDDRPSVLRGKGGSIPEGLRWLEQRRKTIAPLLLRHVDPPDGYVAGLVRDGDLQVPVEPHRPQSILLSGFLTFEEEGHASARLPLSSIAASSALLLQAFIDISAANHACGGTVPDPMVRIERGSLQITVGGGLFASGVALLVACGSVLVGAPVAGIAGGAILATAGVIELAIGSKKTIAETRLLDMNALKADAERRKTELEIKLREIELERAQLERDRDRAEQPAIPPGSAAVPRAVVRENSDQLGMSETYANHLLNRALPRYRYLRQRMAGVEVKRLPSRQSCRRG